MTIFRRNFLKTASCMAALAIIPRTAEARGTRPARGKTLPFAAEITPFDFGARGDGVVDDTRALQAAIDAAIASRTILTSPMAAVYAVSAPLKVGGMLNADFRLAEIKAVSDMPDVISYDAKDYYTLLRNLRIDANGKAGNCLHITHARKMRVDNLITNNHLETSLLINTGYEIFVQNTHINAGVPADTTGIKIHTSDSHFSDIVIIDCKTAIHNEMLNFYSRIHAWTIRPDIVKDSVFFDIYGNAVISESYADTYQTCFRIRTARGGWGRTNLIGCSSYYNPSLYRADRGHTAPVLFHVDEGDGGSVTMQSCSFNGHKEIDSYYSNIDRCAVRTDDSNTFIFWKGAPGNIDNL